MTAGIEGTVVIITGASSGMGEAAVRHLAGLGASVVVPQGVAAVTYGAFVRARPKHDDAFNIPLASRTLARVIAEARA